MKTKTCTTIEQSKKLMELGIDVNTADIYYTTFYGKVDKDLPIPKEVYDILKCPINGDKVIPAWSLTSLLELMPDTHLKKYIYDGKTRYYITKVGIESHNSEHYDNPIDAAFEMVVWLKENNKI